MDAGLRQELLEFMGLPWRRIDGMSALKKAITVGNECERELLFIMEHENEITESDILPDTSEYVSEDISFAGYLRTYPLFSRRQQFCGWDSLKAAEDRRVADAYREAWDFIHDYGAPHGGNIDRKEYEVIIRLLTYITQTCDKIIETELFYSK